MVIVKLGPVARAGIESCFGDLEVGVRAALIYYAHVLRGGLEPLAYPRFRPQAACRESAAGAATTFDLRLGAEDERTIAEEAASTGTALPCLAGHAVLIYLAELERFGLAEPPEEEPGEGRGPVPED